MAQNIKNFAYYLKQLNLEKNPAAGYFRVVNVTENPPVIVNNNEKRVLQNTAYSLYQKGDIFPFHSLKVQHEHLFHIDGGSMKLIVLDKENEQGVKVVKLGKNIDQGEEISYSIKPGQIFALECETEFTLLGAVCTPGWDFADFTIHEQQDLLEMFPNQSSLIEKYGKK